MVRVPCWRHEGHEFNPHPSHWWFKSRYVLAYSVFRCISVRSVCGDDVMGMMRLAFPKLNSCPIISNHFPCVTDRHDESCGSPSLTSHSDHFFSFIFFRDLISPFGCQYYYFTTFWNNVLVYRQTSCCSDQSDSICLSHYYFSFIHRDGYKKRNERLKWRAFAEMVVFIWMEPYRWSPVWRIRTQRFLFHTVLYVLFCKRVGLPFDMRCPYLRCVHLVIPFCHFNFI